MTRAWHLRGGGCGVRGNLGTYGPANNRLMRSETYDTSGPTDALMSTTYYRYNVQGSVTRVITEPYRPSGGESDFTATRFIYPKNGSTVTYVMGETWNEGETCPDNYAITYAREFRYGEARLDRGERERAATGKASRDARVRPVTRPEEASTMRVPGGSARARYLNRELNTTELESGNFVPVSDTWTDYDGDIAYGDFTIDGITVTDGMWYEPGIARSAGAQDRSTAAYYHADLIGTTRDVSVGGASTGPAVYTAFGEQVSGTTHRYGYVGAHGYQTDDTGAFPYQHVGARYYDPTTGRFLQRDPIGIAGGWNVYEYVNSTPTLDTDPLGLLTFTLLGWGSAGTIASCGTILVLLPAEYIVKPAIERRNRRIDRTGNPRFRRPFNPKDPWDWDKGTTWQRQGRKWREKHQPKRTRDPGPLPEVPCGLHY